MVILSGCQDKAIYTDLFTLSKIINEFGKNYLLSFLKKILRLLKMHCQFCLKINIWCFYQNKYQKKKKEKKERKESELLM